MKTYIEKIINKNNYLSIKQVIKQQNLCQLKEKKTWNVIQLLAY